MRIPASHENARSHLLYLTNHTKYQMTTDMLWLNNMTYDIGQRCIEETVWRNAVNITSQGTCQPSVQLPQTTLQIRDVYRTRLI